MPRAFIRNAPDVKKSKPNAMTDNKDTTLLAARYALTREVRKGGMSMVTKAADIESGQFVAIKAMLPSGNDRQQQESMNREYRALETLRHPNIVSLIDAGKDKDGKPFLVLEWIDSSLHEYVLQNGRLNWVNFFERFGKPVLDGLAYAQRKRWVHRDIKPKNILLTSSGIPKISDYGIARNQDSPRIGLTLADFKSEPYTPPEADDGRFSYSRDCFSFAALAVYCLSGEELQNYSDLTGRLSDLEPTSCPRFVLETALSSDPAARHPLISNLLADFEKFERERIKNQRATLTIHLTLSSIALEEARRQIGNLEQQELTDYLLGELNEGSALSINDTGQSITFRLYGITWVVDAHRSTEGNPGLVIDKLFRMWPTELERIRQNSSEIGLTFTFDPPSDWAHASSALDDLTARVAIDRAEKESLARKSQGEQIFRSWYNLLRARSEYEIKRQGGVRFELIEQEGIRATLRTANPLPDEIIGQSRLIKLSFGKIMLCDVINITFDELVIAITFGDPNDLPRRGQIETNTFAEERALEKQRQALDSIYYDRAAASNLKSLLASPRSAQSNPLFSSTLPCHVELASDKLAVLKKAVVLRDVLVVKGPPGTGKTRLIEEIIVQYLTLNTDHRILLSSQTHVALDNVLERVLKRNASLDVVRVGKVDDPRIAEVCRPLLLEHRIETWAKKVKLDAERFLKAWASEHGLNKEEADTAIIAERLVKTINQRFILETEMAEAERSGTRIEQSRERQLNETGSSESQGLDHARSRLANQIAELTTAIDRARRAEEDLRRRLHDVSRYGSELSDKEPDEIKEWIDVLLKNGVHENKYRELLNLQEEWIVRVGRSSDFYAATLASAKIVAGTCIGLAGVRGFNEVSYDLCILDEASKATATEALVPMARSRRWILVGDPQQLPPFLDSEFARTSEEIRDPEIKETLLDRFIRLLPTELISELRVQHRMIKPIGDLVSKCFYEGALESARTIPDISVGALFKKPVTWLNTSQHNERKERQSGQSYENPFESRVIRDVLGRLNFLASKKKRLFRVAVTAGYMAQVKAIKEYLRDYLHEWTSLEIICNTVDSFQGQQADVCIYSVTRSNPQGQLGFLREKPRLNVALSRARDLLVIVGDAEFCDRAVGENPFRLVLRHIENNLDSCEIRSVDAN